MAHTLERRLEDLAIVVVWEAGFEFKSDAEACARHILQELDRAAEPAFLIIDMRLHEVDLDILLATARMVIDGQFVRHHPHLKQMLLVYEGDIKQLSVTSPEAHTASLPPVRLFTALDDALTYVTTSTL